MMAERLWQNLFEDPTQWRDRRCHKGNPNQPDFIRVSTGECLWIDSKAKPSWVEARLTFLKAGSCQAHSVPPVHAVNGVASCDNEGTIKQLRRKYFDNITESWVPTEEKRYPGFSDFRHNAKCGAVRTMDEYSWTALVSYHTKHGQSRQALEVYAEMQKSGVKPSSYTFVSALKACGCLRDLEGARRIHVEVVRERLETVAHVGNVLVDVYAKCGSLVDARRVFDKMANRNVVSWNAMILGYANMHEGREALRLYASMQTKGAIPNNRTFVSALTACGRLAAEECVREADGALTKTQCLMQARSIHMQVVKGGFESDVFVATMLVDVYAKCGSLVDARCVFENMHQRDVVPWTALISGYSQMQQGEVALQLYKQMQKEGVVPNNRTFFSVLKACCRPVTVEACTEHNMQSLKDECLENVRAIHADICYRGLVLDVFIGNLLVDVYAKCGSLVESRCVFDKMPHRDVISWTSMILSYAQMGDGQQALRLFARMQHEGVAPNDRTFVALLKACSNLAAVAEGRPECDSVGAKSRVCLEQVRAVHSYIVKCGCEEDMFVATMLVDVYTKCGSLSEARDVFEKMPHRDVASWNSMILGYVQMEKADESLLLYSRMQQEGVVPDARTFVGALKACGVVAGLDKGMEIHSHTCNVHTIDPTGMFVAAGLIDMYGKCGSMRHAQQVFDSLPRKDVVTWSGLMAGYAHQGQSEVVFDLFQKMSKDGIKPDAITFLTLLTACSHGGLVDKGQMYLDSMSRDYGINPTMEHYNCVIDLLGRAGEVGMAVHMLKRMPFKPTSKSWRCVLGACRKWKEVQVGMQAFKEAVRLDKHDAAAYTLMSNIYADAGMWEDASRVRTGAAWKKPGQSCWTDVAGLVHTFAAGDQQQHPESQAIQRKLEDLTAQMEEKGYTTTYLDCVSRDLRDDAMTGALCGHSVKLAIAYALLKTPPGTSIRVVKNLRACEECHTAIKMISRIEKRTIMCRDLNRFHVIENGNCSCGDNW